VFFAIQVSLAALLQSWGLRPAMIVGHCVGEIAAAHIAGMLTLGDAVRLVHDRARIAERARGLGGMAAVEIDLDEAAALLSEIGDGLGIAAINGPSALTLSGPAGTLGEVCARLTAQGRFARVLDIDYPFHGRLMEPMVAEMAAVGEDMPVAMPTTPIFSAVLGRQATRGDFAPDYWSRNLRETIRFAPAITAMAAAGCDLFVEIGSHPILSYAIRQVLEANGAGGEILATMHRESDEAQESDEAADLRGCAAAHFVRGVTLDWSTLAAPDPEWKPQSGPVIDQAIPPDAPPPRSEAAPGLREALAAAAPGPARRQIMERRIRERLAEIIGTSSTRFDTRLPFNALGLDSLTALRLRDALERDTGLKLPAAVIFNHATIASLATELAARLGTPLEVAVTKPAPAEIADDDELSALLAALREMPEEEALRLLEADAVAR
jgi:acyl transferase domain-containing protein